MARITVEDCLHNVENLFQLVLLAAQRARRLANGAEATLPLENDKPTVLALREIAAGNITAEMLREPEPAPEPRCRMPTTSRASAPRSSVSETDGLESAMDYASSLLGLLPGGRRTPGLKELLASVGSYLAPEQVESRARGGRVRHLRAPRPEATLRGTLHRPPGGDRGDPRRPAPRRRHHHRGDPARRHRGHPDAEGSARRALRRRRRRAGRRRHQARSDQVQEPRGGAGGVLPQDAAGDGARPARHPGQARRPHPQHAHHRGDGAGPAPGDRARDARDLRPDRRAARALQHEARARGLRVQGALPAPLPRARARLEARPRQPEGVPAQDRAAAECRAHEDADRGARGDAREAPLQHLPEDAPQARAAQRDRRRLRHPHRGRHARHLLPRTGRGACGVQAHARALQGLHRHPARQRLPVPAHHALRSQRRADRGADPHRRHAPRGGGRHRRALALQDRQ